MWCSCCEPASLCPVEMMSTKYHQSSLMSGPVWLVKTVWSDLIRVEGGRRVQWHDLGLNITTLPGILNPPSKLICSCSPLQTPDREATWYSTNKWRLTRNQNFCHLWLLVENGVWKLIDWFSPFKLTFCLVASPQTGKVVRKRLCFTATRGQTKPGQQTNYSMLPWRVSWFLP